MEVSFSSSFKRAFKRRIKGDADLEARFWQKLEQFIREPFEPSLKTHKLSGRLKEFWSFSETTTKGYFSTLQKMEKPSL